MTKPKDSELEEILIKYWGITENFISGDGVLKNKRTFLKKEFRNALKEAMKLQESRNNHVIGVALEDIEDGGLLEVSKNFEPNADWHNPQVGASYISLGDEESILVRLKQWLRH